MLADDLDRVFITLLGQEKDELPAVLASEADSLQRWAENELETEGANTGIKAGGTDTGQESPPSASGLLEVVDEGEEEKEDETEPEEEEDEAPRRQRKKISPTPAPPRKRGRSRSASPRGKATDSLLSQLLLVCPISIY